MGQVTEARPTCRPVSLFFPENQATRQPHLHDPTHITHKNAYVAKKFLSFALYEFVYVIQPVTDMKQFWIWAILALSSASCPSRAGRKFP